MNEQIRSVIEWAAKSSKAGTVHFGDVVKALVEVGVESYYADYRAGSTTYYLPDGTTHILRLDQPDVPIAEAFDTAAIREAIGGAQRGEVMYPQFLCLSRAAGCVGYFVWLAGRHVSYFGRLGQTHIEHFPN
jgi:uncharacterized protein YbcV (DUF1398 family)